MISRLLTLSAMLALLIAVPTHQLFAQAQTFHAGSLMLDDGLGHTVTLLPPTTGSGGGTITLPPAGLAWPTSNATGMLTNDGSGNLSWSAGGLTNWTEAVSTAAPNAGVPIVSFRATNAATDVDAALIPKGAGAIVAAIADNTVTGGNKRGSHAVDLQTSRTANTQAASGFCAVVGGGFGNTASNNYATVAGGFNNAATGTASAVAGGQANTASASFADVAGGAFNAASGIMADVAGGYVNTASGYASSVAGGQYNTATGYAQTVVGQYNLLLPSTASSSFTRADPLFIVGNGVSGAPENAFTVNGNAVAQLGDGTHAGTLNLGDGASSNLVTIVPVAHAASETYTIRDQGAAANFVLSNTAAGGPNAGQATLVGGTATVSTTYVASGSLIYLTVVNTGSLTNVGTPVVGTITAGTSFVIRSTNAADASTVNWFIVAP